MASKTAYDSAELTIFDIQLFFIFAVLRHITTEVPTQKNNVSDVAISPERWFIESQQVEASPTLIWPEIVSGVEEGRACAKESL